MSPGPSRIKIDEVRGVGAARAQKFKELNIITVADLLYHFPRKYEDRKNISSIAGAEPGNKVLIRAEVKQKELNSSGSDLDILKVKFSDQSGTLYGLWFNQNYLLNKFEIGHKFMIFGRINSESWQKYGRKEINNPIVESTARNNFLHTGRIVPFYSLSEDLSQRVMRKIVFQALNQYQDKFKEWLPAAIMKKFDFPKLKNALREFHFPRCRQEFRRAKFRFAFAELFIIQLKLLQKKASYSRVRGKAQPPDPEILSLLTDKLDFSLTASQKQAWHEIAGDLETETPMQRLLQGDVGSGKTIVALLALLTAASNDNLGVFMAPTEILAEQHYLAFQNLLEELPVKIDILTGSKDTSKKELTLQKINNGVTDILIGTHALLENYDYPDLGLVVIDEQHKFGVNQRRKILEKGDNPDLLVMTATPIPRSLALTYYGDMDISTIEELPSGRPQVITTRRSSNDLDNIYNFIKQKVEQGEKAYIVCPLINAAEERPELSSVMKRAKFLTDKYFSSQEIGVMHGGLSTEQKRKTMKEFKHGGINVLVSTTVIEVGLDVPGATFMVIENAEQFGLAQLHQLRGRVGRGSKKSYCILIAEPKTERAQKRIEAMINTEDGFEIAEQDLKIRGPGKIFGEQQHGISELRVADFSRHEKLLEIAREEAGELLKSQRWQLENPALANKISRLDIVL